MNHELNVLVAEHVMGWRRTGDDDHIKPYHERIVVKREGRADEVRYEDDWDAKGPHPRLEPPLGQSGRSIMFCGCDSGELPDYSGDIAAAWEVIIKLYADTGKWMLIGPSRDKWEAYEATGCADPDFGEFWEVAPTAPEAICRAALKAKGIEVSE